MASPDLFSTLPLGPLSRIFEYTSYNWTRSLGSLASTCERFRDILANPYWGRRVFADFKVRLGKHQQTKVWYGGTKRSIHILRCHMSSWFVTYVVVPRLDTFFKTQQENPWHRSLLKKLCQNSKEIPSEDVKYQGGRYIITTRSQEA